MKLSFAFGSGLREGAPSLRTAGPGLPRARGGLHAALPRGTPSQLPPQPGDESPSSPLSRPAPLPIPGTFLISFAPVNKTLMALLDMASKPSVDSKGRSLPQRSLRSPGEKERSPSPAAA